MQKRIPWIDNIKALGMFLVVFAHCSLPENLICIVYSFHIPLFFFASGLTFQKPAQESFVDFCKKKIRTLVEPYFFFAICTYLFWLLVGRHFGEDALLGISPWHPLIGMFYSVGTNFWLAFNAPLWFLTCLFVVEILFWFLENLNRIALCSSIIVMSVAGFFYSYLIYNCSVPRLPWSFDCAMVAIVFFAAGFFLKQRLCNINKRVAFAVAMPMLFVCVFCALLNGRIDMLSAYCGNPLYFYGAATSGIVLVYCVSRWLPNNRILEFIGKNTLIVLGFHLFVGTCIKGFLFFVLHVDLDIFINSILLNLLFTVAIFICMVPVIVLLRKFVPMCIGIKKND